MSRTSRTKTSPAAVRSKPRRRAAAPPPPDSDNLFHPLFQLSPIPAVITRASDGRHMEANDSFLRLVGLGRGQVLGRTAAELGFGFDPAGRRQIAAALADRGRVSDIELAFRAGGRRIHSVLVSAQEVRYGGRPCILVMFCDVTELRRAQRELGELKEQLAALASERGALLEGERRRQREADVLRRATAELTAVLDFGQVLERILTHLGRVVPYDRAAVFLKEGDDLRRVAGRHYGGPAKKAQLKFDASRHPLVMELARTHRPILLADAQSDPRFGSWPDSGRTRSWMAVPLLVRTNFIGCLTLDSWREAIYDDHQAALAEAFAAQAAISIENATLYQAEQRDRRRAETIRAASLAVSESLELDVVLDTLLAHLDGLIAYDSAAVLLFDADGRATVRAWRGFDRWIDPARLGAVRLDANANPILRTMIEQVKSVVIDDTHLHPDWERVPGTEYVRSWLGSPLVAGGKVLGLYSFDKAEPGFFRPEHLQVAESMATHAAVAIENARLFDQVRQARERLRQLSQQVIRAQEVERARLSRELHDEFGQRLIALRLHLDAVETDRPTAAWLAARHLSEARAEADTLAKQMRLMARDLRPVALGMVGLNAVLEDCSFDLADRMGLAVQFAADDVPELPSDGATALYRFLQEALTNVARHALARSVRVALDQADGWVRLAVEDDGQGFDPARLAHAGRGVGIGLLGMRERLELAGGQLTIDSEPGRGTRLIARVPVGPA